MRALLRRLWGWLVGVDVGMADRALAYEIAQRRRRGCEHGYELEW